MSTVDERRFNWFEHASGDAAAAQSFYAEVLPWTVESFPLGDMRYPMIKSGEVAIGGFTPLPPGVTQPHWVSYLRVTDVDRSAAAVTAAGGKLLMEALDVPTVGRMQPFADPQGGTALLFTPANSQPGPAASGNGTFHWNELWCRDPAAALAFYERVFGFTHVRMEMPHGSYYVLEHGGVRRGGIMASPIAELPTHWLPYVAVDDLDGTLARVQRNRGKQDGEPITTPGVGRYAFIRDPQGARMGLITPAARA
ncbi:MAG: VOC family protein [Deltaproteobacteria bacterium]|nr:VOC family protein [Nannocystaceae bacterium]